MSAVSYAPALEGAHLPVRPSLARLSLVEVRKTVDTRSGKWLAGVIVLLSLAAVTVGVVVGTRDDRTLVNLFSFTLLPTAVFLPVLGILLVTSEWSQKTALTTFTLVPWRERIVLAKVLAGLAWSLFALLTCLLLSLAGNVVDLALDRGSSGWSLPAGDVAQALLLVTLSVTMGVAFGMVFLSSPVAIVLYFVLPIALSAIRDLVSSIAGTLAWLDLNQATSPLIGEHLSGRQWGQLATSSAVWVLLPLALGAVRLMRSELK